MSQIHPYAIERTTLGIMLFNPTNENLDMQYAGISLRMEPGEKQLFALKCASHLLNAFGARGLTALEYGADEERVAEDGRKRNTDFKKKQVIEYNQRNENRKQMGMGYLPPTEDVKRYAIELGLKLLEPYAVRDEERSAISQTASENAALKAEVAELKAMMAKFLEGQTKKEEPPKSELRVKKDGKWQKETTNPAQ